MTSSMVASTAASFASSTMEAPEAGTGTGSSRGGVEGKSAEVASTVAPVTEILNAVTETKQTDTVPVIAQHNTPNTHNKNHNHNNNNNTKTVPTAVVENSYTRTANPNSKIPHPLVALLASKTNQFRRSASVRMRGSKANFLFNTFNRDTHSHRHSCSNNKSHIHNHSHPRPRTSCKMEQQLFTSTSISSSNNNSRHGINNTSSVPTQNDQTAFGHHQVTDGLSTGAGRVSPRRKLVLSSQPNAPRSLSLNRAENLNQHKIEKTDPFTELEVCCPGLDEAGKDEAIVKQHNCDGDDGSRSCSSLAVTASSTDQAKVIPSTGVRVDVISCSTPNNRSAAQGCPAIVDEPGIRAEHNNKMSLNLNGPQTTGTTLATTKTAATATTTAPVASTTNIRPTTLTAAPTVSIAGNTTTTTTTGSVTIAATATTSVTPSRIVTKTLPPKTPKTPATTRTVQGHQQQQASNQQHCSHQHCSAKYQYQPHQQHLPTVPETIKPTPRTPPVTPDSPSNYLEDDIDSLYSFATTTSGRSTMSCEHPYVACNGTTFSGRKMKYVVHCSNYAGQVGPDYLTPTQRAQRQIRRLKELLSVARHDLEQKDSDILGLTREVVELRLFKASLSSPEDRSASSDAVTVREAELKTSQDVSPIVDMVDDATKCSPRHLVAQQQQQQQTLQLSSSEMQSSFADSGHFEDMTSSSVHSKDSFNGHTHDIACGRDASEACATGGRCGGIGEDDDEDEGDGDGDARKTEGYELQRQNLIRLYEQRIEELIRTQDSASSEIKRSHNDKVEALLQKLAECNTRYADIVLSSENAKERIRELEKQLEDLQRKLAEHEDKQNKMYLQMYQKGQEAERIARADQALELAHRVPNNKVSINELLLQLQSTQDELENIRAAECRKERGGNHALLTAKEAISLWVLGARKTIYRRLLDAQKNRTHVDPEVTLQFLKSAVYYFLTDKENSQGHLRAIESILEFTETEKQNISKARAPK